MATQKKTPKKTLDDAIKALSKAKTKKQISKCAGEVIKLAEEKPERTRTSPKYSRFIKATPDLKGRLVTRFYVDRTLDFYVTDVNYRRPLGRR